MKNFPPCPSAPAEREHLGYIEEYYLQSDFRSEFGIYLGSRVVQDAPQPLGAQERQFLTLAQPIELKRSFSKIITLPLGHRVIRVVWPLQGREIKKPLKLSNVMMRGSTTDLSGHANPEY